MKKNEDFKNYYNIGNRLGQGKFGEVYEATTKDSNEKRAIKILDKKKVKNAFKNTYFKEPEEEEMKPYINCFLNEVRNMKLALGENEENENAVKLYEYFDNENEFAIVMERCDSTLLSYLDKIKDEEKHNIINQLNKTIKKMVDNQLIYIDLRLENILIKFVNEEKTKYIIKLKLTDDIGLVKQFRNLMLSSEGNNRNNCIDAPEILKENEYNHKSDLWSLGVIIYVLYFREYPYKGTSSEELLEEIKKGQDNLKKTGNLDLDNLIRALLIEEPEERMDWNQYFNHPFFVKKKIQSEDFRDYYKIENEIGNPGFATVYKARTIDTDELRAIKVFDKKRIKNDFKRKYLRFPTEEDIKPYINGFFNEINHIKMVEGENNENNNTIKYYEYYQNEDEFAIVMELCDSNLLNIFADKSEPYSPEEIGNILSQLNNSFIIMNNNKLVHAALNLENILIKYKNKEKTNTTIKLKLTNDSCLLKDLHDVIKLNKNQRNILFQAPEILKEDNVNEKCDLWSLGVIIYTLATKEHPFKGNNEEEILDQINNTDIKLKIKTGNPALDDLILKLLTIDPERRLTWKQYFRHSFIRQKEDVRNYYEIGDKIGQSRFAHIYKAREKESNELRAIKIYDKDKIRTEFKRKNFRDATDEDLNPYIIGFNNEINNMKIVEGKEHKNIYTVKFYEHFHTNDEFSIVMELCDDNLFNVFSNKILSFNNNIIKDILEKLNVTFRIMAQNKIVHRALNFENILIKYLNKEKTNYIFKLKLTDDSLIKDLPSYKTKGKINSDYFFISPEILKRKDFNEECDLWSLGVIIYTLLFREYPFKGNNEAEILKNIQHNGNNLLKKTDNSKLNDLISKLLIEDPKRRITWNQYFNHLFFGRDFRDYYKLEKEIGNAGFATIYKAKSIENGELRAIKIFDKNKIRNDFKRNNIRFPTEKEMKPYIDTFYNEVNHMKIVQGKNDENEYTVHLYEYFDNNEEFVIVMELCDDNLLTIFANRKDNFSPQEIYGLLTQLNASFKIMVENNLVHRALNLENILIKYKTEKKDSYIIKLKLTNDSGLIKDLSNMGKSTKIQSDLTFIAPEILKRKDYNEECDLWSLGVIIYALTFREHPFSGDNESEILQQIRNKEKNIKKTGNPYLDDLIQSLLVQDPSRRITWKKYFNHSFFNKN